MRESIKKYSLLIFCAVLLFPAAASFGHIFSDHEHKSCTEHQVHLHEKNLECEIIKYKPNPVLVFDFFNFEKNEFPEPYQAFPEIYQFLSDYQNLAFVLRGPPQLLA